MNLKTDPTSQPVRQNSTILIVDDNPHNLGVIVDYLETENYTVLIARDGESALEKVRYGQPDLILLDIMMPGIDGFETCRRLKADPQTRDIPIIFMTALTGVEDKVRGFALGAVDYLIKPVQQEEVLARVKAHLRLQTLTLALHQELARRQQAEEQFRLVVEAIPNAIVVIDESGKIIMLNPQTERLFGYTQAELIGQPVERLLPARFQADHPRYRAVYLTRPETRPMGHGRDLYGRHKDGREIPLEIGLSAIDTPQGRQLFSIIVDISERKRAEATLAQKTQELERSNQELEQFAYVASHDLQEPLRMVTSYLNLLERRYKEKLDPDAHEFIAFAVDGAKRMKRLITDLLAYSRVGMQDKALVPVNAETVLAQVLKNLQIAIEESQAVISHDPLPTVLADEGQLVQLFQNLIGNALKFRGDSPPQIHIGLTREQGAYLFSVRDNGIGLEPEQVERVFIIFQRVHDKGEYPGSGIGLAICKKIVERHGGRIWVESQPGQGATFYFTLPLEI
jgi:PAS domain S-box-containing protein